MYLSAVIVTTSTSPSEAASSKCSTWPMCTRSKAPWQRTIFLSRRRSLRAARSGMVRIFRAPDRSRFSEVSGSGSPGLCESSIASIPAELHSAQHFQRAQHVDDVPETERFARALLTFNQIHRHFDDGAGPAQALDEHFRLKAVSARLNLQALEHS